MFPAFSSRCLGPGPIVGRVSELRPFAGYPMELVCCENHFEPQRPGEIERFRLGAEALGLRVLSIHGQFTAQRNLSSADAAVRDAGLDAARAAIETAAQLRAGTVILHLSDRLQVSDSRSACLERALDATGELLETASPLGITLAVENLISGFLMNTTDEVAHVLTAFPENEVGFCFDTGHWCLTGRDARLVIDLGHRIVTTHIHDNLGPQEGPGEDDSHMRPGRGIIDWKKLALSLSAVSYTGPFILELDQSEWGTPDEIAAIFEEILWSFDPHD